MLKITGYILFVVCCVLFLAIPVIPWLGFSKGKIAGITTVLVIAGEITFYLSLFILGKEFYAKLKSKLKFRKSKPASANLPEATDKINPEI
jgi:hypothetical protein